MTQTDKSPKIHFANVPKKYSVEDAEIMLKSYSAKKMFEMHPGFRKRYPRGGFWSGYEHHESTGRINFEQSGDYCRNQQYRHGITVVDDRQQQLPNLTAERGCGIDRGACRGSEGGMGS